MHEIARMDIFYLLLIYALQTGESQWNFFRAATKIPSFFPRTNYFHSFAKLFAYFLQNKQRKHVCKKRSLCDL